LTTLTTGRATRASAGWMEAAVQLKKGAHLNVQSVLAAAAAYTFG
jgi:hypothetical protein